MSKTEINSTLGTLSFDIDTSAIEHATAKLKESLEALELSRQYWDGRLGSGVASVDALQGCVTGYAIDPLEAAIESTARVMRDERESMAQISMTVGGDIPSTSLHSRMGEHLDKLLALQLKKLSGGDEELVKQIQAITEELRANAEAMNEMAKGFTVTTKPIGSTRTRQ